LVALRGKEIDAFLARPDSTRPIILLFGADAGLVRERAEALIKSAVDDPNDPFALVRLDGDDVAAEPSRLVDEALTIPMFGGRRAIRVRAGSKSFVSSVEALIESALKDCRVVIEAGDLKADAALRKTCERAKNAVTIACYLDDARAIGGLIDEELRISNLRIASDARAILAALLGGDRQSSRNELRKLTLYAHGQSEITLDDVIACVSDASDLKLDPVVDYAFAGNPAQVETEFAKAMNAGTYPGLILSAAQRHAALLHKAALLVDQGTPASNAADSGFPRLHFSRKAQVEAALRAWTAPKLVQVIDQLATATLDSRKQASLAAAIAQRALLSIAVNARRRG
jgi:DNA polymerase-3 subunit delta